MEIDFLILTDEDGGAVRLTSTAAESSYGIPVLEITGADISGAFGPGDLVGDLDKPETLVCAADIVRTWLQDPGRTPAEAQAARLFLGEPNEPGRAEP